MYRRDVARLGLAASLFPAFGRAVAQTRRDSVTIAQAADAQTMDPGRHTHFPTANVLLHVFDGLVSTDAQGQFRPALAESWNNPNATTWQFKLRRGVRFHNGEEFDADAVKSSFERILNREFRSPMLARVAHIRTIDVVDKFTVNFTTAAPFPTMLFALNEASFAALIMPPRHMRETAPEVLARQPIGTGPYRFVEWRRDERVVLEANPDYWGGAPKIRRINWRPISETRTRIAELRSGGIDVAGDIPPEEVQALNRAPTKVVDAPSESLYFFTFDTLKPSPLRDKRVRQALHYAVDIDAIQRAIMGGYGQRIAITLPTTAFGYPRDMQPYPYDPARARALLAEAGHAGGFSIPLTARQGRFLKDREVMEAAFGFMARVGVRVEVRYLEQSVWAQVSERKGREGLIFGGWSGMDPDLVWYPLLYTGQYQSYYSNPALDALLDRGRSTLDQAERLTIYRQAAEIIREDAPLLPMFQPPQIYAMNAALNWRPRTDTMIDLRAAEFA
jgi:peptide/nickel transport system substrate-binding protein